ncbi:uncharacterized protein LOC129905856 [Episyrphus balteatus]|uniref:uncharacterized protein LOC129905856 n=1 Tax=Episyrphus balteatus TaxID=286459 RepID=UPI0024869E9C|nr:uncharacterized protein LOC129905856 [Episyrphus balteatus]
MRTIYLILLLSVVAISADLESDFEDIFVQISKDHQVQSKDVNPRDNSAIINPKFRSLSDIGFPTDFNLLSFLTDVMNLSDVKKILDFLKQWGFDINALISRLITFFAQNHSNMLGDLIGMLTTRQMPSAELIKLIQEKIETSPEFAKFASAVQDPKFKELIYQAVNSKDVQGKIQGVEVRRFFGMMRPVLHAFSLANKNQN